MSRSLIQKLVEIIVHCRAPESTVPYKLLNLRVLPLPDALGVAFDLAPQSQLRHVCPRTRMDMPNIDRASCPRKKARGAHIVLMPEFLA